MHLFPSRRFIRGLETISAVFLSISTLSFKNVRVSLPKASKRGLFLMDIFLKESG